MTSAQFSGFWTPSPPLSVPNPRNLASFRQKLANPLPPPLYWRHLWMAPNERTTKIGNWNICSLDNLQGWGQFVFVDCQKREGFDALWTETCARRGLADAGSNPVCWNRQAEKRHSQNGGKERFWLTGAPQIKRARSLHPTKELLNVASTHATHVTGCMQPTPTCLHNPNKKQNHKKVMWAWTIDDGRWRACRDPRE